MQARPMIIVIVLTVIAVVVVWRLWMCPEEFSASPASDSPPRSVVVLLPSWSLDRGLEMPARVRRALGTGARAEEEAHQADEDHTPGGGTFCRPIMEGSQCLVRADGVTAMLNYLPGQYFEDSGAVAATLAGKPNLAGFVRSHRAFISVDSMGSVRSSKSAEYEVLCKIANEYVAESEALFIPEYDTFVPLTEQRREQMRALPGLQGLGLQE